MMLRRAAGTLVWLTLLAVVAACSSPEPTPSSAPAVPSVVTSADASRTPIPSATASLTSAFDLATGDCFDTQSITTVDEVTLIDCDAPHSYEVFGVSDYEGGILDAFPGEGPLNDAADEVCRAAFEDYVGIPYDDSTWSATYVNPSQQTWEQGDREILCVLHEAPPDGPDGTTGTPPPVTGSAEGSER